MNDNIVAQLHRSLVDALRRTRPAAVHRPVTVAEIYQDLVPYRTARAEVGFEMNADYEHTLLRLLAGEGDLARIEPREVRDKLRMELESPNPDVGLFRNYAACDVWVNIGDGEPDEPAETDEVDERDSWEEEFVGPTASPQNPREIQAALGVEEPVVRPPSVPFEIAQDVDDEFDDDDDEEFAIEPDEDEEEFLDSTIAHGRTVADDSDSSSCAFCGGDLPAGRMVNFCPFCGTDQAQQPCPSCGEMLDPLWRFCISCGARVRPLGDHVN